MPWSAVHTPRGISQEAFLVEARSDSGYSGSPVFVTPQYFIDETGGVDFLVRSSTHLLGVDCGHFPTPEAIREDGTPHVALNTGFMIVVPSWRLVELLNDEFVQEARAQLVVSPP
jgi:hypothetical protein